jgi:general secretion pathway protein B
MPVFRPPARRLGNNLMSYILDALKKAESERALGSVPGLHAQPVPPVSIDGTPAWWRRVLVWGGIGLAVVLAALAWFEPWRAAPTPAVPAPLPVQAVPVQPPVVASTVIPGAAPSSLPAPEPGTATNATVASAAAPGPAPKTPTAKPAEASKPKAAPKPLAKPKEKMPAAPAVEAKPSAAEPAEATSGSATPAAPEVRVPMLRELPANIQREIPPVVIGGYIYAGKPAERSVLINNRLLREGDQIAPGLTLERMMPREAVLNYRGNRYRVPY